MNALKRIGIDTYMLLLVGTVLLGLILPARGIAAEALRGVTFWAVTLLFFLYGAKLDPASVRAGLLNWRLQGLTFAATYLLFPEHPGSLRFKKTADRAYYAPSLARAITWGFEVGSKEATWES